jgi:hypothetical protein
VQVGHTATGQITNTATVDGLPLQAHTPVMVTNGMFEAGDLTGWTVKEDDLPEQVVDFEGSKMARLGVPDICNTANPDTPGDHSAAITQSIPIPNVPGTPVITFRYRIYTYDHVTWTDGNTLGDSFDVYVNGQLALRDNYENYPERSPGCSGEPQDSGWLTPGNPWFGNEESSLGESHPEMFTLSDDLKGQTVEIRFELWARVDGYYNTWAYVDDVLVEIEP